MELVILTRRCELSSGILWSSCPIANSCGEYTGQSLSLLLLCKLPLPGKLDIVFIEDYFLDVVGGHLTHEKRLRISFFITLHYFVLEAKKLQDLLKHSRRDSTFLGHALWHLGCSLLSVNLNRLLSVSELIQLVVYL